MMKLLKGSLRMMVMSAGVIVVYGSSISLQVNSPEWIVPAAFCMFFGSFIQMGIASIKYRNEINQWFYEVSVRINSGCGLSTDLTAEQHKRNRKN